MYDEDETDDLDRLIDILATLTRVMRRSDGSAFAAGAATAAMKEFIAVMERPGRNRLRFLLDQANDLVEPDFYPALDAFKAAIPPELADVSAR